MWQDPIVAETRALRDEYARQFNYDIDAMFADLVAKQATHPERLVSFPPRKASAETINETSNKTLPTANGEPGRTESVGMR